MIRIAEEEDAPALIHIKKEIILSQKTTKFFISSSGELPDNPNVEIEKIRKSQEKNNLYIVAEFNSNIVGFLIFNRYVPSRLQHTGSLGMGIVDEYTNQGIGTKLLERLIDWARKENNIEKICLGVTSLNKRAIHVYKCMGFKEEGKQINQIKYEDGTYSDDILMAYYI
ncbi:GNAT family N-acetyltransferase [Oceanobacillus kapialis]|uniref:GNAT family N-acetyltransferase n=1 Tax=Oceanobacillus kapialis TaxID=481353 RepID=A0ABW5Q2A1_9BACI